MHKHGVFDAMNAKMKTLLTVAASASLLVGCCTSGAGHWEYKLTVAPPSPEERSKMQGPSLETREKYLNSLAAEGWILVTEDQGVFYLKRHR
jgi:hypothetical protein